MAEGLGELVNYLLVAEYDNDESSNSIKSELCKIIKGLCVHDDLRKDMSCAYENAKYFLTSEVVRPDGETIKTFKMLIKLSENFKNQPYLASCSLSAAKQLINSEEAVKSAVQHGAMDLPLQILSYPASTVSLIRSVAGLMRNLCADDLRKNKLVSDGSLNLLVNALSCEKTMADVKV